MLYRGIPFWYAPGSYYENINFNGKNISLFSQYVFSQDTTDIVKTVIDGSDSGCVVVFENGEDSTAIISGFTISNGYTYNDTTRGGGITCINSAVPILSDLILSHNQVVGSIYHHGGAGVYCKNKAQPTLRNVIMRYNDSQSGVIRCVDSSYIHISNSIIEHNISGLGTIYILDSQFESDNLIITNNYSKVYGGGIYFEDSYVETSNTKIMNNEALLYGGGFYIINATFSFDNVFIDNNKLLHPVAGFGGSGGGIYMAQNSNGTINNSIISSNISNRDGGGIYIADSQLHMYNVDLAHNMAEVSGLGGGLSVWGTETTISLENVNIYDNLAREKGGGIYCRGDESVKITLAEVRIFENRVIQAEGGGIFSQSPSNLIFSSEKPSSVYLNKAHMGGSDMAFDEGGDILTAVLDTFTVSLPEDHHLFPANRFNLTIQNPLFKTENADLYVSPDGSDSNSGVSESEPLRSVSAALAFASTDSLKQRYINLAPGVYSHSSTGEDYPLYGRSNVSVVGKEPHSTIIDGEDLYHPFYLYRIQHFGIKNLTIQNGNYDRNIGILNDAAGIFVDGGKNIEFENLIIRNNIGSYRGGGISIHGFRARTSCTMKNLLVYGNTTESSKNSSYGIYMEFADAVLTNITIADNSMGSDPEPFGWSWHKWWFKYFISE